MLERVGNLILLSHLVVSARAFSRSSIYRIITVFWDYPEVMDVPVISQMSEDAVEERSCAWLYVLSFKSQNLVMKFWRVRPRSAIFCSCQHSYIPLPALFVYVIFPSFVTISREVFVYILWWGRIIYTIILLGGWHGFLSINQNILPKRQEPYSLSSYIFLSLMKIEVKCNFSLMMWSLLVIQLVILLASYTYMLIGEKTRLASRSLIRYRHISYQINYSFAIC